MTIYPKCILRHERMGRSKAVLLLAQRSSQQAVREHLLSILLVMLDFALGGHNRQRRRSQCFDLHLQSRDLLLQRCDLLLAILRRQTRRQTLDRMIGISSGATDLADCMRAFAVLALALLYRCGGSVRRLGPFLVGVLRGTRQALGSRIANSPLLHWLGWQVGMTL